MKPYELIRSALLGNRSWEQFSILLARVSLGTFFAILGGNYRPCFAGRTTLSTWVFEAFIPRKRIFRT